MHEAPGFVLRDLVARIALQEYTQGEAAELMGLSLRSVVRKYADALDQLSTIFLRSICFPSPLPEAVKSAAKLQSRHVIEYK